MSDMPGFRAWADSAHRDSLRTVKAQSPRFKCSKCHHKTSKGLAKKNGGFCFSCKAPLRAKVGGLFA